MVGNFDQSNINPLSCIAFYFTILLLLTNAILFLLCLTPDSAQWVNGWTRYMIRSSINTTKYNAGHFLRHPVLSA
jgi:hypothetical protein